MDHNLPCVEISYLRTIWKLACGKQRAVRICGDDNHEDTAHKMVL